MLIVGLGDIFDGDTNVRLAVQAEISVNFGAEVLSVPAGDTSSNIVIQTAQPVTGSFRFRSVNAAALVTLTAGSSVVSSGGATSYRYIKESLAVATDAITLTEDLALIGGDLVGAVVPRNGRPLAMVNAIGNPTNQIQCHWDAGNPDEIRFETTQFADGALIDVTYYYEEVAGASRIFTLTPSALPPSRHYVIGMKVYSEYVGTFETGGIVFDLAKVTRVTEAGPMGATVGDTGQFGFDWEAVNTSTGDVRIYLPSEGGF